MESKGFVICEYNYYVTYQTESVECKYLVVRKTSTNMGSFIGHAVPGAFFTLGALWWTFNIFWRYFTAHFNQLHHGAKKGGAYKNTLSFSCDILCTKRCSRGVPWEVCLKLVFLTIGMVGEYITALDDNWSFTTTHNLQHIMMYAFFAIHPVFELGYYWRIDWLPPNLDYMSAILAYAMEAFLFHEHLLGRNSIDIQVHTYLFYTIVACMFTSVFEMIYINDVRPALARAAFTLLQGTWFYQIGFILYPPGSKSKWNGEEHSHKMTITVIFAVHLAASLLFLALVGLFTYQHVKRKGAFFKLQANDYESDSEYGGASEVLLKNRQTVDKTDANA